MIPEHYTVVLKVCQYSLLRTSSSFYVWHWDGSHHSTQLWSVITGLAKSYVDANVVTDGPTESDGVSWEEREFGYTAPMFRERQQ